MSDIDPEAELAIAYPKRKIKMETPYIHPDRQKPRLRPFEAMRRMQKLIADKEDTEQVFHIVQALNGDNAWKRLQEFARSEKGHARLKERTSLPPLLDDHETLLKLPEGTVGHAYVEFMRREGLTASGLVAESEKTNTGQTRYGDDLEWYLFRTRDTHDLLHVLTGYGRDALGETSLLAFTHGQNGGFGLMFIAYMGTRRIVRSLPGRLRLMEVFHEARRLGKGVAPIIQEDISLLLGEPLEEARTRLGIRPPIRYQQAITEISMLGNAHDVLAAA